MIKKIIIISGEPKSINSEIIYKCWKKLSSTIKKKIYVISNYRLLNETPIQSLNESKTRIIKKHFILRNFYSKVIL